MERKRKDTKTSPLTDMVQQHGKTPPQAIDLEEAVLGAMMLSDLTVTDAISDVFTELFYKTEHQLIFKAIREIYQKTRVDILTVTEQLRSSGELELAGGPYAIAMMTQRVASTTNIQIHIAILRQKFIMREFIRLGTELIRDGFDDMKDPFDLLEYAEQEIFRMTPERRKSCELLDIASEAIKEIIRASETKTIGIRSGFEDLDRVVGGFVNSDLTIIAARPGMGKTALVVDIAKQVAKDGYPVAVFSLEMSDMQLFKRLLSSESDISLRRISRGDLSEYEFNQIHETAGNLVKIPIYMDDTPALSVFDIRTRARKLHHQKGIKMIIVDYLQLMSGEKGGNREQEISSISRGMKALAKELDLPVIVLSQLSRECEKRTNKIPVLSDLRESGAIEQDADVVMFIYRESYYNQEATDEEKTEIIIAKNRNGKTGGGIFLKFLGNYTKFTNYVQTAQGKPF